MFLADARIGGKGERRYFDTRVEAETWGQLQRAKRANEGESAFGDDELARYGKTVRDAVTFYLAHLRRESASVSIPDAVDELVATKLRAGKSPQYGKDLANRLRRLAEAFPGSMLAQVTTADLDGFLSSLPVAPGTKNTFRRDVRTLWSFASKRGWADAAIAKHTEAARVDSDAPGILTPEQAAALMLASHDDVLAAFHAIGLFAGLRVAEIRKLDWRDVDLEGGYIHVSARASKTRSRRLVPILENLRAWITPIAQTSGPVVSKELRTLHEHARDAAGITAWPDNAMRHSFVSYRLADTGNAAQTALESGHDQSVLFRHYRELVKPKDAERFWSIRPTSADNVVSMTVTS